MGMWIWLILAAVLAVTEFIWQSLFAAWFVIGALVAFVASYFGASDAFQIILFVTISVILMNLLRPYALKYMKKGQENESTPVGQYARVIEEIDPSTKKGRVETLDKMTWAAESADGKPLAKGQRVKIVDTRSITVIVERL